VLSIDVLLVQWSVRSGRRVNVRARVGGIEAQGLCVAIENGRMGAVVRVVNPDSKKTLVGRVVGPGEVEVIHGS
jgi:flagella basal body P-ring formation protein FlgA